jgi:DNA-binding PadR family transcriptional regulator
MHGYQLNELIEAHLGASIQIKKPTVYKLLSAMVEEGWIIFRVEKKGNYPTRRVYTITSQGETAFQELLRENLAHYKPISYLSTIGIVFLDALPVEEAVSLLRERSEHIKRLVQKIRADESHSGGFQLMISYHECHLRAELEWLEGVIANLSTNREWS